jgi:hypothetical protein
MQFKFVLALLFVWGVVACVAMPTHFQSLIVGNPPPPANCSAVFSCASEGDSCDGDQILHKTCSNNNGTCCAFGLYCISGTCKVDTLGDSCNTTNPCFPSFTAGYPISCVSSMCTYQYGTGDTCMNNTDCISNNCTGGACVGAMMGQTCQTLGFNGGCAWGLICGMSNNTKMCMNTTAIGANCTANACAFGSACSNGTCMAYYTVGAGGNCAANPLLCDEDYICATNGTCVSTATSLTSCSSNTDCQSGQFCVCSQYTGDNYCSLTQLAIVNNMVNPCTEEDSDLNSCLISSECASAGDAPNSCCYNQCYSDFKHSQSCGCDTATDTFGSCSYSTYCGGFPVWAIIVIIVVAIVLVLAVVLLVFFMMRRRRQYDSI